MVALTAGRNTPMRLTDNEEHPVKGGVVIHPGAMVALDVAGFAMPAISAAGLVIVGRADEGARADVNGERTVKTRRGRFRWANSAGGDAITRAEIGDTAYAVDDQTVARTSNTGARSAAGIIRDVDAQGVWVEI